VEQLLREQQLRVADREAHACRLARSLALPACLPRGWMMMRWWWWCAGWDGRRGEPRRGDGVI
jgi:hypothetical protein